MGKIIIADNPLNEMSIAQELLPPALNAVIVAAQRIRLLSAAFPTFVIGHSRSAHIIPTRAQNLIGVLS